MRRLACPLFCCLLAACQPASRVLLISIDGLWAGDLTRFDSAGVETPVLDSLRAAGALAEGVIGTFPSVTYPSHTTMITGVRPARHGIYSNRRPHDPLDTLHAGDWYWEKSWVRVPTITDAAHAAGLSTGAVFWPATAHDSTIDFNVPEAWDTQGGTSQLEITRRWGTPGLLDTLGAPARGHLTDSLRAAWAAAIIRRWDPDLMLVHLIELDAVKHAVGPAADSVWPVAARVDRYVGWVIAAIRETHARRPTTVMVTSDHGFYAYGRVLRPGVLLARAGLVTLNLRNRVAAWDAAALTSGGSTAFIPRAAGDTLVAQRIRRAIPDALVGPGKPIRSVWPPDTLRALGGDPRAAWTIAMNEGFYSEAGYTGELLVPRSGGGHGYDPRDRALHAFFLSSGPGIPANSALPIIQQTDIAPRIALLLGLTLPAASGRPAPLLEVGLP